MEFHYAKRLESFQAGIFAILNEKKEELIRQGREVYNLSVGTPDFKPAPHVMEAVAQACQDSENYKYSLVDMPELLDAVVGHYERRYGVHIEPDEIMSINGSQEGIAHIALALCDSEDIVLVPNPGYPIFSIGPFLCGAKPITYDLKPENHFMPDFNSIPEDIARKAKFIIVSYPLNPVCVAADDHVYEELIRFAKKYDIIVLHDNAYSDIIYDGRKGGSFLAYEGAKEVGVEFYSLSKSYNLTGARISFVVGHKDIIQKFKTVRSQIDYGVFKPVQYGAIAALNGPQDAVIAQCKEYERRNKALCGGLRSIGWDVPYSEGTMFVWAPIPKNYTSSEAFCMDLVEKTGVLCTPGSSFGTLGEGYVRFALVRDVPTIEKMIQVIDASGILK